MVGRREQTAADFDPRGFRFGRADQPCGDIAIDLGKLILVDVRLAAAILAGSRRPNGHSTAKIAAAVISANTNHSVIKRFPAERRLQAGTDAPLYTTGDKPGN